MHPFREEGDPLRRIPVVTDAELVDPSTGTGAVKITPAHDPNDYKVGKAHKLEFITCFDDYGSINHNGGQFKGQHRFQARVTVEEELKKLGLDPPPPPAEEERD